MNTNQVIIFGNQPLASLAWYCLTHDSPWQVVAFTVDGAYINANTHEGLPVVPFERLEETHDTGRIRLLIPLGYRHINGLRMQKFNEARQRGYQFVSYISSRASVWPDLQIGENCMVYEHAIIQPFAHIGDNVIIRSGVHISHHTAVGDHCFIGAEAALAGNVQVGERCFIGVNATVIDNLRVAERTFVGAGAVVIKNTEQDGVYAGNPARKLDRSSLEVTSR
ncbi:MAG: acetyltransferase [Candidatus Brocadiaceae bacterium]|nr:acetyltransferase [Candidatus Brocadiaceae bacterium]